MVAPPWSLWLKLGSSTVFMRQCTALIRDYGRTRLWQSAVAVLEEMPQSSLQPSVITYSAVMSACARGEQWHRVFELLSTMQLKS